MTSPHIDQGEAAPNPPQTPDKRRQWLWFVGLWCAGLLTVSTLGYIIKFFMSLI